CLLVLTDFDSGRKQLKQDGPIGPGLLGREVVNWRAGARMRPRSVVLGDFSWRQPTLDLQALSPSGQTDFMVVEQPGRYESSKATGEVLAKKREERLDSEREFASGDGRCRALSAGSVIELDHPNAKFSGEYVVVAARHVARQHASFGAAAKAQEPY